MFDQRVHSQCGSPEDELETFRRWESFREACGECLRIWVSLVIPSNLPDQLNEILDLWMAEQVRRKSNDWMIRSKFIVGGMALERLLLLSLELFPIYCAFLRSNSSVFAGFGVIHLFGAIHNECQQLPGATETIPKRSQKTDGSSSRDCFHRCFI